MKIIDNPLVANAPGSTPAPVLGRSIAAKGIFSSGITSGTASGIGSGTISGITSGTASGIGSSGTILVTGDLSRLRISLSDKLSEWLPLSDKLS